MRESNISSNHIILERDKLNKGIYILLINTEKFTTKHKLVIN